MIDPHTYFWLTGTGSAAAAALMATVKLEPWARERFMWWTVAVTWVVFAVTAWVVLT